MRREKVLMLASVASMIDQFNMPNIRMLQEMGYEVHVACNFKEGNTCDVCRILEFRQELENMRAPWHQWDCPRCIRPLCGCVRAYRQLQRLLQEHAFAWMHCHSPVGGALARAAAHRAGIPVIYTAHGFHFYKGAPLKNWLLYYPPEWLLSRWTDVVITVNKEDERIAKQKLRAGKVYHIPGVGVDMGGAEDKNREGNPDWKQDFRKIHGIPSSAVILLSVGELSIRKNHQLVISVLPKLSRKDVYYLICGQGVLKDFLQQQAERLGVASRVKILGFQENVWDFYKNADIFVFPSLQEGLPAALMEAMAAGLPCVVSDIRGNRELADTACFPLKHPAKLQEHLEQMLWDGQLRQKQVQQNLKIIKKYDRKLVDKKMKKIYAACGLDRKGHTCKKKLPEISVVMPVYQTAPRQILACAIDSIRGQTYRDWELIICDDGSADGTWEFLKKAAHADPRIRLCRHMKNHGAGAARNTCIQSALGHYIAMMDADDISAPDRLEKQHAYLESHPKAAFAGSRGMFFNKNIGDGNELYWYCKNPKNKDFLFSLPYVHASIMFRKEALEQVHGYDASRRVLRAEDYDLLLRMCGTGLYGHNLEDVLYYIRRDKKHYQRRKYRYRFHETYVKYQGFKKLGLFPAGMVYAIKPLLVGLIPVRVTVFLQKRYYIRRSKV